MRFLADVNIPQAIINDLTESSHDVLDLKKINLAAEDVEVIKIAQEEKRVILTLDKDFVALTQFPKHQVATIVIRLKVQNPKNIWEHLDELLAGQRSEILESSLTIVTSDTAESHPF